MLTTTQTTNCPRCKATLKRAEAVSGNDSEFWLECPRCNTYVNTYQPMEHQSGVHKDQHRFIGNFGGYGTGKTTTTRQEVIKHLLITPNANVVVGANVSSQYEQTIKRELENDLPKAFIKGYSVKNQYMDLLNGARLMWRSFDDPGKLRSLNLTMFVIIEGSETTSEVYNQLKTRLRNTSASKPLLDSHGKPVFVADRKGKKVPALTHDWRKGIVESNPDSGYIRTEILLASDKINQYGEVADDYKQDPKRKDTDTSSHVASSSVNQYLPADFIAANAKNKPQWWVLRYLYGSFQFSEGNVYPMAAQSVISTATIPKHWKRLVAHDYGLSDNATFVFGALDPADACLVIYREEVVNNRNVNELAKIFKAASIDIPDGGYYTPPIIDPKSGPKRDYDKKSLADHYLELGIYFQPGHVNVDARVFRTNTYFESGKLKIMDCCPVTIDEFRNYKFPPRTLDGTKGNADKPIDKNNHCINPVEWMCMMLPSNPEALHNAIFNGQGARIDEFEDIRFVPLTPWQLNDDDSDPFNQDPFGHEGFDMRDFMRGGF